MPEDELKQSLLEQQIQSLITTPLILENQCIGFIGLDWVKQASHFENNEVELLELFAQLLVNVEKRSQNDEQIKLSAKVFESAPYGLLITDKDNRILMANPAYETLSGFSLDELKGNQPYYLSLNQNNNAFYQSLWHTLKQEGQWQGELINQHKNGRQFFQWMALYLLKDNKNEIKYQIAIIEDLTEHKSVQQKIDFLSHFDLLTKLPNRNLFHDRIVTEIETSKRENQTFAIMQLDLDRFRTLNDSLGFETGDQALKIISERIKSELRLADTLSRESGDEFFLILPKTDSKGAANVAKKILEAISLPISIKEQSVKVTACIGIALYPEDGKDFYKLIESAGAALHRIKRKHLNHFEFFTRAFLSETKQKFKIESELHQALDNNELLLYFQPQYDAKSHQLTGAEALIRWRHPKLGIMPPAHFIPVAEKGELILKIGDWVLKNTLQKICDWQANGLSPVPIAINLSAMEFYKSTLIDRLSDYLRQSKIDPGLLEIEITETMAMEDSENALELLNHLHQLGVKLALDDFGTGYSSLNYLHRFQLDKLKIDQSFVRELSHHQQSKAIIATIIDMAKNLGYITLAEGVETEEQAELLTELGCDQLQGYLFNRPFPAEDFAKLLAPDSL